MVKGRNLLSTGILAALALALLPGAVTARAGQVPVVVGNDPTYDACDLIGQVQGLNPQGDGFLAVRTGPGTGFTMRDKLHNGDLIYICDDRGSWLGVVYASDLQACGVDTPWPRPQAYTGPCDWGWVSRKFVVDYAG